MASLGKTIKLLRVASGLRQSELAKAVGITSNYLSLIESDRKEPSLDVIGRMGDKLGVGASGMMFLSMGEPENLTAQESSLFVNLKSFFWGLVEKGSAGTHTDSESPG